MSFEKFKLHSRVMSGVHAMGYEAPTPIQRQAIPPVMEGRDVMGLAQTGTGKTAAFALPILHRLLDGPRGRIRALVVAPTRELAEQINDAVQALGKDSGLKSTVIYGGVNINPQIDRLRRGVDVVVACPGRLLDHLGQKTVDLSGVEVLVLDEADRMFDMGFLPDIRRLLKHLPARRQTLLFSATMPPEIRGLAGDILRDPVTVQIGILKPVHTVAHALYPVPQHLKTALLTELLKADERESVIVFTRTKHRAKRVAQQLEKTGHKATCLQGNLSQNRRMAAMDGFRNGTYDVLVATDIASRGIDVTQISHVINYDIPDTADAYTHRIGRTGRQERSGDAFTLVTAEDEAMIRDIEKVLGEKLERRTMPGFDYSSPAPRKDAEFARPPREPRRQGPAARPVRQGATPHSRAVPPSRSASRPDRPPQPLRYDLGERRAAPGGQPQTAGASRNPRRGR